MKKMILSAVLAASLVMCVGCENKENVGNTPYNIAVFHNEEVHYELPKKEEPTTTAVTTTSSSDNQAGFGFKGQSITISSVSKHTPSYCYIEDYEILEGGIVKITATDGRKYLCYLNNVTLIYDKGEG